LYFLTTPNLSERLGGLDEIAAIVDIDILSQAMVQENSIARLSDTPSDSRLWLLSQFINIHRIQQNSDQEANYLRALAVLLSDSANEIIGRIDGQEFQISQDAVEEEEDDIRQLAVLLPTFVREQLISLVNRESITGLLGKFDT
jgi:ubiquitin-protein ligase E3 C